MLRSELPKGFRLSEVFKIAIAKGLQLFLFLNIGIAYTDSQKIISFSSLYRMECIFKYDGIAAVISQIFHGFPENNGLVLSVSNLGAGKDFLKEIEHAAPL